MVKFLFAACLSVLLSVADYADTARVKPVTRHVVKVLHMDSSKVHARNFNNDALQQYHDKKDFQYDDNGTFGLSYWERFWRWVWHILSKLFSVRVFGGFSVFSVVLFTGFIVFLIYVVFKVMGMDLLHVFRGNARKVEIPYAESLENIHEINFDQEIEKAVEQRNYKLAVRLLYLRCLKQLSDAQLIHWQIEKTNSAYLNELTDDNQRQSFGVLTRQFEYIWYGDFLIDGPSFQNINSLFQDFKQLLR